MTTAILIGISVLAANLVLFFLLSFWYSRQKARLVAILKGYFESPAANTPSQFAQLVGVVSDEFGHKIVAHAKGTFMGIQSGEAKNVAKLEGAIASDMLTLNNPLAAGILESFPALAKHLRKSPSLIPLAERLLSSFAKKQGPEGPESSNGGGDYAAQLALYK